MVVRPRLIERVNDTRITVIAALPGYGKTVVVQHWVQGAAAPTAWISVGLLGTDPKVFWSHFLGALRRALPLVDDEPEHLLKERGPEDPLFLEALAAQVAAGCEPTTIVLDGLSDPSSRVFTPGLGHLVERAGDALHLVITSRFSPTLHAARWRTAGWLTEIRESDLRLTDDEAVSMAECIRSELPPSRVISLNRRLDGWPIGLHMALLSNRPDIVAAGSHQLAAVDRTLAEYLVTGVLSGMPDQDRQLALKLSVLRWFDADLGRRFGGIAAEGVIQRLLTNGTFLSVVDPRRGVMQFHTLFRELMELHLSVTDPVQRVELHRLAAEHLRSRGETARAYEHLVAIGESDSARKMLIEPALDRVADGDLHSLREEANRIPATSEVGTADLALDLAVIAFLGEGTMAATRWCDHAEALLEVSTGLSRAETTGMRLSLLARRGAIALMDANLESAFVHVERYRNLLGEVRPTDSFGAQFPVFAARVMLALRRERDSAFWIQRALRIDGPDVVTQVTVPALRAWHEWLFGDLHTSVAVCDAATTWIAENTPTANHLTFDALITAGWCRVAIGDLEEANQLSRSAVEHADSLGYAWQRLQAGYLAAQVALLSQRTSRALRIIDDLRADVPFDTCRIYSDRILALELEARATRNEPATPNSSTASAAALTAHRQLRQASAAGARDLDDLLADREDWILPDRIRAEVLLAASHRDTPALVHLVADCAHRDWVLPFLRLPRPAAVQLRTLPLDELHPRLAHCLDDRHMPDPEQVLVRSEIELTPREASLLPLLQTHLSYAEIGQELFLSVNTVKSNLQRLYRKLGAHTRHEAVVSAQEQSLL